MKFLKNLFRIHIYFFAFDLQNFVLGVMKCYFRNMDVDHPIKLG